MTQYVFVGSIGEGYRSGATEVVGVYLSKSIYDRYEEVAEGAWENTWFSDLDGKHSECEGDLLVVEFDNIQKVIAFYRENDTYDGIDQFSDIVEDMRNEDLEEDEEEYTNETSELYCDAKKNDNLIREMLENYTTISFTLPNEDAEKVIEFVKGMEE